MTVRVDKSPLKLIRVFRESHRPPASRAKQKRESSKVRHTFIESHEKPLRTFKVDEIARVDQRATMSFRPGGGGVHPYKGLVGMCGQSGYFFRDFCLKQGINFYHFVLNRVSFLGKFLRRGIVSG